MTRSKETFTPSAPPKVSFYSCGPTVYDYAHIGNFRAFLTYDILKRWLMYLGYDVEHVCNLTDIDDKIIARMQRDGVSLKELTNKFADLFFEDLDALNVVPASAYPRATEHVDDIVDMVATLVSKGKAYEAGESVYFDVSKAARYGRLARLDVEGLEAGASEGGVAFDAAAEKRGPRDFALWKAFKEADGEVSWETQLGKGRPGWHIECSAMARHFFGDSIDLHAGGVDLVFPHHENEIAQSEAVVDGEQEFCAHWVHNGFVNVDNEKMSKSKGNFVTLRQSFPTPELVRAFRYLVVLSQYRQPLNFNQQALDGATSALKKLDRFRTAVLEAQSPAASPPSAGSGGGDAELETCRSACAAALAGFEGAMSDDLNTPRAGAALFGLLKAVQPVLSRGMMSPAAAHEVGACLEAFNAALGIFYDLPDGYLAAAPGASEGGVPDEVLTLVAARCEAKDARDWGRADALREEIGALGFDVKDVKGGEPLVTPRV